MAETIKKTFVKSIIIKKKWFFVISHADIWTNILSILNQRKKETNK